MAQMIIYPIMMSFLRALKYSILRQTRLKLDRPTLDLELLHLSFAPERSIGRWRCLIYAISRDTYLQFHTLSTDVVHLPHIYLIKMLTVPAMFSR